MSVPRVTGFCHAEKSLVRAATRAAKGGVLELSAPHGSAARNAAHHTPQQKQGQCNGCLQGFWPPEDQQLCQAAGRVSGLCYTCLPALFRLLLWCCSSKLLKSASRSDGPYCCVYIGSARSNTPQAGLGCVPWATLELQVSYVALALQLRFGGALCSLRLHSGCRTQSRLL